MMDLVAVVLSKLVGMITKQVIVDTVGHFLANHQRVAGYRVSVDEDHFFVRLTHQV